MTNERRTLTEGFEVRQGDSGKVAVGYAAVFDIPARISSFTESVGRSAFDKTLQEADVLALYNHEMDLVLGRSSSGTLRLSTDERGLAYEIDLPDTNLGRDVGVLLERGDLKGSSFGFRVIKDDWEGTHRTLQEVALRDVGPVTTPAYSDSSAALRSLAADYGIDLGELVAADAAGELRQTLGTYTTNDTLSVPSGSLSIGSKEEDEEEAAEESALPLIRRRYFR